MDEKRRSTKAKVRSIEMTKPYIQLQATVYFVKIWSLC